MKLELEIQHGCLSVNQDEIISNPEFATVDFRSVFRGAAFKYEDFTQGQINEFKQPALDAAAVANTATTSANQAATIANQEAKEASVAAGDALASALIAEAATENAITATTAANTAAENAAQIAGSIDVVVENKANKDLSNVNFIDKTLVGAIISDAKVTKSLVQNGYYKAPDGLMLQWGTLSGSNPDGSVKFPQVFKSSHFVTFGSMGNASETVHACSCMVLYLGQFLYRKIWVGSGAWAGSDLSFYWIAIGTWK